MPSALNPKWLIGLAALFLSACATSPERDGKQESDLAVLVIGVESMLPPRDPAGPIQLVEQAEVTEDVWNLALDLEEVDYLHEADKVRTIEFVRKAAARIGEARQPCSFWDRLFNRGTC